MSTAKRTITFIGLAALVELEARRRKEPNRLHGFAGAAAAAEATGDRGKATTYSEPLIALTRRGHRAPRDRPRTGVRRLELIGRTAP